jgi:hypothetical protein
VRWDVISRDREAFGEWIREHVMEAAG